jgi:hypothetical protein
VSRLMHRRKNEAAAALLQGKREEGRREEGRREEGRREEGRRRGVVLLRLPTEMLGIIGANVTCAARPAPQPVRCNPLRA